MQIDRETGLLTDVIYVPSPNVDERPLGCEPDLIVIHGISLPPGEFGGDGIERLFTNRLQADSHPYFQKIAHLRVSAHVLIRRDGTPIQYVPFQQRAWHAGESCYQGRVRCNDFSIGIELEGCDDQPYEALQYVSLVAMVKSLLNTYPRLNAGHIVGHSDIAPGRKTDPGPYFDWARLKSAITQTL